MLVFAHVTICRGLQPILQAFESSADGHNNKADVTAAYFWPLLLHLLMLGELESAAHLLHLGLAPSQEQPSHPDLPAPVASLVQLLEQRMQLAPFADGAGDDEGVTQQVGHIASSGTYSILLSTDCYAM